VDKYQGEQNDCKCRAQLLGHIATNIR
jgi:hypothetical protein